MENVQKQSSYKEGIIKDSENLVTELALTLSTSHTDQNVEIATVSLSNCIFSLFSQKPERANVTA